MAIIRRLDTNSDFAIDMTEWRAFLAPGRPAAISEPKPSPKVAEKKSPAPKVVEKKVSTTKVVEEVKDEKKEDVKKEDVKEIHHHHHYDYAPRYSLAYPYLYSGRYYLGRWYEDRYYPRSVYDTDRF